MRKYAVKPNQNRDVSTVRFTQNLLGSVSLMYVLQLISLPYVSAATQAGLPDSWSCGKYILRGQLRARDPGSFLILLQPGSRVQSAVPLRGLDVMKAIDFRNRWAELAVRIYVGGEVSQVRAWVEESPRTVGSQKAGSTPFELIKTEPCGIIPPDAATGRKDVPARDDSTK